MSNLSYNASENNIKEIKISLAAKKLRWSEQEQKLNIGIIGQVKAGKSSFLNALLFGGKSILPEAATPKTANLTKIQYGEAFQLKIEYYLEQEWQQVVATSQLESSSVEAKVAQELVAMANELDQQEIARCLKAGSEIIEANDLDGLQGILNQYTGNNGSHTPLVKSTEITLPIDSLKGYEIVDTPGMNDPVASRTQKTREYMASCDVVFFLSRASQFLDKADEDLLHNQLPNKGVKRLAVVAGQFDSAIIDDGYNRSSLDETLANLYKRLTRQSHSKAESISEAKLDLNESQRQMLVDSLSNPIFASTFAFGYAHWNKEDWTDSMLHSYNEITEIAEDEWDYEFTQEDWLKIGNFDELTKHFERAKLERQQILDEQKRSYLPDAYNALIREYGNLENSIKKKIDLLQTKEVSDIEGEQARFERKVSSIATSLSYTLIQAKNEAKASGNELLAQLDSDQASFSQLATKKGTREEEYSYEVDDFSLIRPSTWFSSPRTVYRTRTVSYDYLSKADAIESVKEYEAESARQIKRMFLQLISSDVLKLKLKTALLNELDTHSADFDPNVFKAMLENFISKLELPDFNIELGDTTSDISANFNDEVTDSSGMASLRQHLSSALATVLQRLQAEFRIQFDKVISDLETASVGLEEELTLDLQAELAKLKQQILDKEQEIKGYQDYLVQVGSEKASIEEKLAAL
ncbi:dynamin family protein [Vibrio rotiferianus]|uniref:dynamin family protein n=1 Tax=Vibrio rotiferianus TaxID=190895 RepID=UPI00248F92AC|nr:dynamin family protein [Vibrio rotiferianus]